MPAPYIKDLANQLSQLASQDGMNDLAYLLKLASDEAESIIKKRGAGVSAKSTAFPPGSLIAIQQPRD